MSPVAQGGPQTGLGNTGDWLDERLRREVRGAVEDVGVDSRFRENKRRRRMEGKDLVLGLHNLAIKLPVGINYHQHQRH